MEIGEWLRRLALQQYERTFRDNAIDTESLPDLTEPDLEKIGVLLGHRKRMLRAIGKLESNLAMVGNTSFPSPSAESGELRQISVLFCDVVGSTELSSRLGPEDLLELLGAYQSCVGDVSRDYHGSIIQYMGDGMLVCFGYPQTHEHDAEQALRAGLDLIERVGQIDIGAETLDVRIGIATGLVVAGDLIDAGETQEPGIFGETPNLAARLQVLAEPNTVLTEERTRELVGGLFEFRDLGECEIRGIHRKVRVSQVLRLSPIESRFEALRASRLTPLVGRSEEVELLNRRWEQAKLGEGQVVLLSGEPGIGKSRVAVSLMESIRNEDHFRLRYYCSPHHRDSLLYPFVSQIERAAGFSREDSNEAKLSKLAELLSQSGARFLDAVPLFADLLALPTGDRYPSVMLDPKQRREQIFASLIGQLEALARRMPVHIVFEDVHWADSTSLELTQMVVERLPHLPVLFLITSRPEFTPPWTGQVNVSTMALSRLDQRESATLVDRVAGGKTMPLQMLNSIVERADGIPLFIEELTKTVLEGGMLEEERDRYVLTSKFQSLAIPPSLHASLMARLDRLPSVKEVAQIGATIGREFSFELLARVANASEAKLNNALDQLVSAGLVFNRGAPPQTVFIFKHALIQDAAYSTLLRRPRQVLHARIGKTLEDHFPETVGTQPEIIAHHFTQAGFLSKATDYWHQAGERALRRSANIEAATHLKRGIELIQGLPPSPERDRRELRLYLALGPTMRAIKGSAAQELLDVYSRARQLVTEDATTREQMNVLYGLWIIHFVRSEHEAAYRLAQDCIELCAQHQDTDFPALAHSLMGNALWAKGLFCEARSHLDRCLAFCSSEHLSIGSSRDAHNHSVAALSFMGFTLLPLGYPEQAAAAAAQSVTRAASTGHVPLMALALHNQSFLLASFAADAQLIGCDPKKAVDYCVEHGVAAYEPWARFSVGAVLARSGEPKHGMEIMRNAMEAAQSVSTRMFRSVQLGLLATCHAQLGQPEIGYDLLQDALEIVRETDERFFEPELHRLSSEVLLALGNSEKAEEELCHALTVSRQQKARMWELRSASGLARLWAGQGKKAKALQLLAPVYDWFTEGYDVTDLKAAKLLLDGLSAVR